MFVSLWSCWKFWHINFCRGLSENGSINKPVLSFIIYVIINVPNFFPHILGPFALPVRSLFQPGGSVSQGNPAFFSVPIRPLYLRRERLCQWRHMAGTQHKDRAHCDPHQLRRHRGQDPEISRATRLPLPLHQNLLFPCYFLIDWYQSLGNPRRNLIDPELLLPLQHLHLQHPEQQHRLPEQ